MNVFGAVFYPDTLGSGGNCHLWGDVGGLGTVPPAVSSGRAPGQGVWGAKLPRSWKLFCCISSLFWFILEGIVEL